MKQQLKKINENHLSYKQTMEEKVQCLEKELAEKTKGLSEMTKKYE